MKNFGTNQWPLAAVLILLWMIGLNLKSEWKVFTGSKEPMKAVQGRVEKWKSLLERSDLELPMGYTKVASRMDHKSLVVTFTNKENGTKEELVHINSEVQLELKVYSKAFRSSQPLMDANVITQPAQFREVTGTEIAEIKFGSKRQGGSVSSNIIRLWSHDGLNFWHLMTTFQKDNEPIKKKSEQLLEFMIGMTKDAPLD